jgi:hypothetical protein
VLGASSITNVALWVTPDVGDGVYKDTSIEVLNGSNTSQSTQGRVGLKQASDWSVLAAAKGSGSTAGYPLYIQNTGLASKGTQLILDNASVGVGAVPSGTYKLQVTGTSYFSEVIYNDIAITAITNGKHLVTKEYLDNALVGGIVYQGTYDAATDTPALEGDPGPLNIKQGWYYTVNVAGDFFGVSLEQGDALIAEQDNPTTVDHWSIISGQISYATDTAAGIIRIATQAEVNAGTDYTEAVTPLTLATTTQGGQWTKTNTVVHHKTLSDYVATGTVSGSVTKFTSLGGVRDSDTLAHAGWAYLQDPIPSSPMTVSEIEAATGVTFALSDGETYYPNVAAETDFSGIGNDETFTYAEAQAKASELGGRLPTLAEVQAGIGKGTGGGYDTEYIWTSTEAGYNKVYVCVGNWDTYGENGSNVNPTIAVSKSSSYLMRLAANRSKANLPVYYDNDSAIRTAEVKAQYTAGLKLVDKDGLGILINDGGSISFKDSLIDYQANTDVDTGTEVVASVPYADYDAAFFDYVIVNGSNKRAGTVVTTHDGSSTVYNDTSTVSIGDTDGVVFSTDINGSDLRLLATVDSDNWVIKAIVRAI